MSSHPDVGVVIDPVPTGEVVSPDFELQIDGRPIFVHQARVSAMPFNQVWPGYQRPLDQTELASFASWDMAGPVELKITAKRPFQKAVIRPYASGIPFKQDGQTLTVTLTKPAQFVVELDGIHHALHCFANPPEENVPSPGDPNVLYFGPGVHQAGIITGKSNQTIYIAGGAVVYGVIEADDVQNLRIAGRGILDASKFKREDYETKTGPFGGLCLRNSRNCVIEGIILRDPHVWTLILVNCLDSEIRGIKLIGLWRLNSDGIDLVTCQRIVIRDCFVRAFDDCIVLKGMPAWGNCPAGELPIEDILVERCVLFNDWGRCLEIGAETNTPHIKRIVFRDCDLIHVTIAACDIQHGDNAHIEDVLFEDIRVEMDDDQPEPQFQSETQTVFTHKPGQGFLPELMHVSIVHTMWSTSKELGQVNNVRFKNIQAIAPQMPKSVFKGADANHVVRDIQMESITLNGKTVKTLVEANVVSGPFAEDIRIRA